MKRIEVERTLHIGCARMVEGQSAYVKFEDACVGWIFAKLVKLTDTESLFETENGNHIGLEPKQIMIITDKNVPEYIARELHLAKDVVPTRSEIKTQPEGVMCERNYREFIRSICEREWNKDVKDKADKWAEQPEVVKQDYYDNLYDVYADMLGKCCEDCRKSCEQQSMSGGSERFCTKYKQTVSDNDYCDNWEAL